MVRNSYHLLNCPKHFSCSIFSPWYLALAQCQQMFPFNPGGRFYSLKDEGVGALVMGGWCENVLCVWGSHLQSGDRWWLKKAF